MHPSLLRICGALALAALVIPPHALAAPSGSPARLTVPHAPPGLRFEANRGQTDTRVGFVARARAYTLFLEPTEAVFAFAGAGRGDAVRVRLVGADPRAEGRGSDAAPGATSYFVGRDAAKWRTSVPSFARVTYAGVYPGVDATYYRGRDGGLEYDFVVAPGADPSRVVLAVEGPGAAHVDPSGDLVIATCGGELREHRPVAYQIEAGTRREVACRYEPRRDGTIGLRLGAYDRAAALVVDPTVAYATFLGGSGLDAAYAVAKGADGSLYLTGYTVSADFPGAPAAGGGDQQVFVTKLNPEGTDITFTAIVGGSGNDVPSLLKLDAAGNVYVRGITGSTNFPTVNAAQSQMGGGSQDLFVFRLNPTGASLAYSTYLGGQGTDQCFVGLDVDAAGNAYVTGCTDSPDYPTKNAIQPAYAGAIDGVLTKLSPAGQIVFSTYLGGSGGDAINDVAVDAAGAIHLVGSSGSDDFPLKNALQPTRAGGFDGVVAEVTAAGDAIVYSTFFGGTGDDFAERVVVDSLGTNFVSGETSSHDLPTVNALQPAYGGGIEDGLVAKISADGASVAFATYIGGSGRDRVFGIGLDGAGGLHLAGQTTSVDFPTKDALQSAYGGGAFDCFVAKTDSAGVAFDYSTYLGGNDFDGVNSIAVDDNGNTFVPLLTNSADFPFIAGFQTAIGGGQLDGGEVTIADAYGLDWTAPRQSGAPPTDLTATLETFESPGAKADEAEAPRGGDLTGYNVYRSTSPNVQTTPENLYTSVPPTQTNVDGAPGGSFFVVTAIYGDGESDSSNTAAAGAGPGATVAKVKVKPAKVTAKGSGFTGKVQVFVDGIPFAAAAAAKPGKVVQKGVLVTGQSITAYLAAHGNRAVISFLNSDGGTASFPYAR